MKKSILLFMVIIFSITSFSCSGDDDSLSQNNLRNNLIGKWKTILNGGSQTFEKTLIFRNDNTVEFIIYLSPNTNSNQGQWVLEDDVLTISFHDSIDLPIYMQKISFPNENALHFEQVPDVEYEIVEDDFFRVN